MRYLDYLLLVYHNTICLFQQLPKDRMGIHHFLRMMIPLDVLLHHTTPPYSGPDKRTGGYQRLIVIARQFLQNVAHGRGFDIEAADGLHRADLVPYTCILFELFDLVYININLLIFSDQVYTFPDMT